MTTEAAPTSKAVAAKRKTLPELLQDPGTNQRFQEMLGKDARSFQQNILTVFNSGKALAECEPESIIAAAAISASINLSILPSLGQSCIVPYKDGDRHVAQWQIMWKGIVQLAHRSSQYKRIHLAHVYDGELVRYDKFKSIIDLDEKRKKSGRVQGYYFYFELITGGVFEFYWSAKDCVEHGLRYSKAFQKGGGKWAEDPEFEKAGSVRKWIDGKEHFLTEGSGADAMSAKTIVKNELQTWGPLETRVKEFIAQDQAVIGSDGKPKYIDGTTVEAEQAATKTYTPPPSPTGKEPTPAEKLAWARDAAKKQGVPHEQFDAWVAQQPGDEAAKAMAAEKAWKAVAAKQVKAVDAFKLEGKEDATPPAEERKVEKTSKVDVAFVGSTDVEGEEVWVIKDTSEPVQKFYTPHEAVAEAAKTAKKDGKPILLMHVDRQVGKTVLRWVTGLV